MTTKKAVTQQQLYGSNRYLRRCPADHTAITSATATNTAGNLARNNRCQHSQSITALQNVDGIYGSYATLPMATGIAAARRTPICKRHFNSSRWFTTHGNDCCSQYNVHHPQATPQTTVCMCGRSSTYHQQQHQYQQKQSPAIPTTTLLPAAMHESHKDYANGCYFGYELGNHLTDEEDSAFPGLPDREFHMLHRNIPALRRTGVDITGIRQYFYPDGGWGWIICGVSFLVHILTTGLQLSYGLLLFYAIQHLHNSNEIEWLGALSWSISMLVSPFVVTFCRKKSTRLLAIVGGLVLPLGILFTSFATELGQIIFSYGIVFGIGVSMVRESSTIMLGNYFKRRRQFVEMVAMSGEGVGIALFSVILKEGVGKAGWRLGLQIIAALVSVSFFMGLLYRPASLYHPQRRAIQHLKNQRKKMREKKLSSSVTEQNTSKYFFLDISPLKSATVKVLIMTSGVAALGIYTPMFSMSLNAAKEGSDIQDLVLLQTFLGMSTTLGVVISGALVRRPFRIGRFVVNTQVVSQVFISTIAIAILFLSFSMGYKSLCVLSWIYGIGFGGFRYALKILALERVKLKQFSKAWGLIRGIEAIPVLISVPLTSFLNDYSLKYGRAGYYICSAAAAIAGIIIFFISYSNIEQGANNRKHGNGAIPSRRQPSLAYHHCKAATAGTTTTTDAYGHHGEHHGSDYVYNDCDHHFPHHHHRHRNPAPDLLNRSCISLNQVESENVYRSSYCDRIRMSCLYNTNEASSGGRGGRRTTEADIMTPHHSISQQPPAAYNFGQRSVGARMGKRIQKSLSFIQNPYCCDGQWFCNCHNNYAQWVSKVPKSDAMQPLLCTCSSSSPYFQNSRSRSVPEGLSTISQQCKCETMSREIIYLPRNAVQSHADDYNTTCQHHQHHHNQNEGLVQRMPPSANIKTTSTCTGTGKGRYRQQRSQSLSRPIPIHFVEQITTSV